ncbi:hypothetical protein ACG04Q_20245 [Roseateles sp. DXS20W]|uniref:Uncharacterized protein n=1 Tax=Pelomonas lactea TaxID=3299030 RepID=A0ABW7GPM4_9BURK
MKKRRQLAVMVAAVLLAWGGRLAATAEGSRVALYLADAAAARP